MCTDVQAELRGRVVPSASMLNGQSETPDKSVL
jgi:hypothetical protein